MTLSIPVTAAFVTLSVFLWRIFSPYFTVLPIDNLPGPSPDSWWMGKSYANCTSYLTTKSCTPGSLPSFASRQGWKKWAEYSEIYGSTYVVKTLFNVCAYSLRRRLRS